MKPDFVMKVEGVYVGDEKIASTPRASLTMLRDGVEGDRHTGFTAKAGVRERKFHERGTEIFNARQWSAVSVEELNETAQSMEVAELKAEWLGANLLFSGYAGLTQLPSLTRLVFPDKTTLLVYAQNMPCKYLSDTLPEKDSSISPDHAKRFVPSAQNKRGIVGWVERAGIIHIGDEVKVYLPTPPTD